MAKFGVIVVRSDGSLTVVPDGLRMAIGFGRLHVRNARGQDVAIFEPGEWRIGARCDRDSIALAPKP